MVTVVPSAQAALTPAAYTFQLQVENERDCGFDSYAGLDMPAGTAGLVNAGFETGSTAGWTQTGSASAVTGAQGMTAKYGAYFGFAQSVGCDANGLEQTFTAQEGTYIEGSAFFKTSDYAPYTDYGRVRLLAVTASGPPVVLFESDVCDVGDYGSTGWLQFQYTFTDNNNDGHPDPGPAVSAPGSTCITDADLDAVPNLQDNCPSTYNPDQQDSDFDGIGNVCDSTPFPVVTDTDGDGMPDSTDNCPSVANADQANLDGDAQGDACDPDDDNDTVNDGSDNCATVANADQANNDGDGDGDVCDADDDNDTVNDGSDNCSLTANTDQANTDSDAEGDACDADDDNDTINDGSDNCALVTNTDQANHDEDGNGDACDPDDDNDGVNDDKDNCSTVANTNQSNNDGDAEGDTCDADDDNDTVADTGDNCQFVKNAAQANQDGDEYGDACDADTDGDNRINSEDNCPTTSNSDQKDTEGDGIGDACDSLTYAFAGFYSPVNNLPTVNAVKAGSAVPVKFSLGGNRGLSIFMSGSPATGSMPCGSSDDVDAIEETVTSGGSALTYDAITDRYTYVWKTDKVWAGKCRQLVIKTADGGIHRANFQLK